MILYDNYDDCKQKLYGTYVMYKGKAAYVKNIAPAEGGKYILTLLFQGGEKNVSNVYLDDPDLNYTKFNIGYTNCDHNTAWWCRLPVKQYSQGLRQQQCKYYTGSPDYDWTPSLGWHVSTTNMMENKYPSLESVMGILHGGRVRARAFHRDMALSWDAIHKDFIIEYKGKQVGHMDMKRTLTLLDKFNHLAEPLKEVIHA